MISYIPEVATYPSPRRDGSRTNPEPAMSTIFVYGTLKRGFPNAAGLDAWPLIVGGQWFSPSMLPERGVGHRVAGELWEVDEATLAALDRLESTHLPTGYRREAVMVEPADGGPACEAWVWFKERGRLTAIHSDYLDDYRDRRYVPPDRRGGK